MGKMNGNGTTWKILLALGGALITIGVAWATLNTSKDRIDKIEPIVQENAKITSANKDVLTKIVPDIQKNTEHRVKDDEATIWMKEKISNIETMQRAILEEVRK